MLSRNEEAIMAVVCEFLIFRNATFFCICLISLTKQKQDNSKFRKNRKEQFMLDFSFLLRNF